MNPHFTATNDHARAIYRVRRDAGLTVTTMPACPAPRSKSIVPHYTPDAAICALMMGGAS